MNGHVFPFARHGHDEAQRMLPWLANGTLDDDDRHWVQHHVDSCDDCRQELRELQALRAACTADPTAQGDVDAGWLRMRGRLAQERTARPVPPRRTLSPPRLAPPWLAAALAAQVVLLVALGVVLTRPASMPHTYRTLGTAPGAARVAGNLVIVFDPQLAESGMRRLLAASGARIVDGPNEAGAYVLAVPPARLGSVRDALRSAPGVVMVEALPDENGSTP